MTPEEVKRFAEACGWEHAVQCPDCIEPHLIILNADGIEDSLPDFLTSIDAVIEALECFCKERKLLFEIRQTKHDGYFVDLDKYAGSRLGSVRGETINIAIIRAVLAASPEVWKS